MITVDKEPNAAVISLDNGVMDALMREEFEVLLSKIKREFKHIVLDLKELKTVNSFFISTVLDFKDKFDKEGGEIYLCNLSENVRGMLTLLSLDRIFLIYENRASALRKTKE